MGVYRVNEGAVAETLDAMAAAGLLEPADAALVEMVRRLAAAVDADPANASLWREYRSALSELRELADGGTDAFAELIESLRTPVRDSPKQK